MVFMLHLVAYAAVVEVAFLGQAGFHQDLHRPVHRGVTDFRMLCLDPLVDLFAGRVTYRREKNLENRVALPRVFQTSLFEIAGERSFLDFVAHARESLAEGRKALGEHAPSQEWTGRDLGAAGLETRGAPDGAAMRPAVELRSLVLAVERHGSVESFLCALVAVRRSVGKAQVILDLRRLGSQGRGPFQLPDREFHIPALERRAAALVEPAPL